jgi:hypothetical protein
MNGATVSDIQSTFNEADMLILSLAPLNASFELGKIAPKV